MRRMVGVVIAVVGVLLTVASFVVPVVAPLRGVGIFAFFIGGIVFGLSFIRTSEPQTGDPPPLSPVARVSGMFFEPTRVFQNLRYHPRWIVGFLIVVLFVGVYQLAFTSRLTPEKVAAASADKVIAGGWIPPDKQAEFKQKQIEDAKSPVGRVAATLSQAGGMFLFMLVLAGLYFLLVMIFGGRLGFIQSLSVAVYSSLPPLLVQNVLNLVLLYIKSPDDIDPIKGAQRGLVQADLSILFSPAENPYLYTIAGMLGIFNLYGIWLLTVGLRNTGEKVSSGVAWGVALINWFLGVILLLALAVLFPAFVT